MLYKLIKFFNKFSFLSFSYSPVACTPGQEDATWVVVLIECLLCNIRFELIAWTCASLRFLLNRAILFFHNYMIRDNLVAGYVCLIRKFRLLLVVNHYTLHCPSLIILRSMIYCNEQYKTSTDYITLFKYFSLLYSSLIYFTLWKNPV